MSGDLRPLIEVACGVLVNRRGEVLLAQRPVGKVAAGYWEFPGGKIEPGEAAQAALARELHEELGIDIRASQPLIDFCHAYRDRIVRLRTYRVDHYSGVPHGRESQALSWQRPEDLERLQPQLPTVTAIYRALCLPPRYAWTEPVASDAPIEPLRLQPGDLARLRQPDWPDAVYRQRAPAWVAEVRGLGAIPVLDRAGEWAAPLAAGLHLSAAAARQGGLPSSRPWPLLVSAHDAEDLAAAAHLDADAVVIGHVFDTPSHPGRPGLGWGAFSALAKAAGRPAYAIGGLGDADVERVRAASGQGVAGIRAYRVRSSSAVSGSAGGPGSR